jgi:large subunit ribosomal protein L22
MAVKEFDQVKSVLKYVRISPQKVRKVIDVVKGESVENALNILKFMPHKGAGIVAKVIESAVANADNLFGIDVDTLFILNITADQGAVLKRFRAKARGRGTRILKRTSHITVTLAQDPFLL